MSKNFAEGIRWNLADLYTSVQDPKITSDLKRAENLALDFEKKYKPFFENSQTAVKLPLAALLKDFKEIFTLTTRLGTFAHLAFAEKTDDPGAGAFMQKIQVLLTDIHSHLLFFEVHWNRLDENTVSALLKHPEIKPDLHFLRKLRLYAPYTLTEGEEKIMSIKSNTSGQAFARLFDEIMNSVPFYVKENGQSVKKTEGEVLSRLHSADREKRKMAWL